MLHNITAVIKDKRGRVLSVGKNSYSKTHPVQAKFAEQAGTPARIFLHAEIAALVKLPVGAKPHSIHVMRVGRDGAERLAKPCPACQLALESFGIKRITFT